ncbi:brain-specific angiogenesis inhibitor 1-associated protein 2-like protein 1 isoform X2 [Artibeus jamaicensis]|uniref:brain-specific angiogenesis inhibitor 1-associated protein 2-like protein 1 isoform X2 n=1 Tax=Artibeus jamaicensis TaxID=9417 RepID=UPI00235AF42C|nr:brain-specific angiogenesis inhibitor 1-associated protein 2-like protein 1 isoform X2 [Artibeus jamaicensis]
MSKGPEEVNRLTESTYRNVMEQFNPRLRNLINLGKNYEKAVNAMVLAGKAYYDGVAKIGELATGSPVSTELGRVLTEISSAHQKLDENLKENFKTFHKEIIYELEKKTELDVKYMNYVETITSRQNEIQKFIADGCKEALREEKRRFCFLVDKHCSFSRHLHDYHLQSAELLNSKLPRWQNTCCDATRVPEEVIHMIEDIKTPLSTPASWTPQPSPMVERSNAVGKDYDTLSRCSPKVPPAPSTRANTSPLVDMFNNPATATQSAASPDDPSLQRSVSVATGLNMMKKQKVKTIFPHTAGSNQTLLSFAQGDVITLLVSEEKDGWLYGEHDASKARGWFPSSYTKLLEENAKETVSLPSPSPAPMRSMSTVDLSEKSSAAVPIPPPDYLECLSVRAAAEKRADVCKPPPACKALESRPEIPSSNNTNGTAKLPFLSGENPFATVKLRPTVTNDRSAPIIW